MAIRNNPICWGSAGVKLPEPLFDTKLAGYLVHPDFHADTLEQAAAHFLDLHVEEQSESATQGTLDFDEPEESVQQKDDQLPRHTAIVGLLARNLANSLDQRGNSSPCWNPWRFQYLVCFMAWNMPVRKST